jgi:adenylate cyclase
VVAGARENAASGTDGAEAASVPKVSELQRQVIDAALLCMTGTEDGSISVFGREIRYDLADLSDQEKRSAIASCVPALLEQVATDPDEYCFTIDGILEVSDPRPRQLLQAALLNLKALWELPGGRRNTQSFKWSELRGRGFRDADFGLARLTFHAAALAQTGRTEVGNGSDSKADFDYSFWLSRINLEQVVKLDVAGYRAYRRTASKVGAAISPAGAASTSSRPPGPSMTTKTLNILFMDLAGWSKLSHLQIANYLEKALPRLAEKIQNFHSDHLNTWGDAVVATFSSAVDAANCALDIRDFFRRASEKDGVPQGLEPRVSLHVGEVITAHNPLIGKSDVFGEAVHLAARLEPVTERGQVFCTAEFATSLRAHRGFAPSVHELDEVELPKGFGKVKTYLVTGPNETSPVRAPPAQPDDSIKVTARAPQQDVTRVGNTKAAIVPTGPRRQAVRRTASHQSTQQASDIDNADPPEAVQVFKDLVQAAKDSFRPFSKSVKESLFYLRRGEEFSPGEDWDDARRAVEYGYLKWNYDENAVAPNEGNAKIQKAIAALDALDRWLGETSPEEFAEWYADNAEGEDPNLRLRTFWDRHRLW